jgi:hypothetical protein
MPREPQLLGVECDDSDPAAFHKPIQRREARLALAGADDQRHL